MQQRISIAGALCLLVLQTAGAQNLECDGCVGTGDLGNRVVTTTKIRKQSITEGKLAPELQQRIRAAEEANLSPLDLIIEDANGQELPVAVLLKPKLASPLPADLRDRFGFPYALTLYELSDDIVISLSISRCGEVQREYCLVPAISVTFDAIYYSGLNCTGQAYAVFGNDYPSLFPSETVVRQPSSAHLEVFGAEAPLADSVLVGSRETGGTFLGGPTYEPSAVICENSPEILEPGDMTVQPVEHIADINYTLPLTARYRD